MLRQGLESAVRNEQYEEAAQLRDLISEIESTDRVHILRAELDTAIKEERYVR